MHRADFLKHVHDNRLVPAYLFLGEERLFHEELIRAALDRLIEPADRDFNIIRLDAATTEPETLAGNMGTPSFFGGARVIYLDGLESAASGLEEALLKNLSGLADGVYLLVSALKLDGRKKIHQELQKHLAVVDCSRLTPNEIPVWLKQRAEKNGLKLSPGQIRTLTERLGVDLVRCRTELEKLQTFLAGRGSLSDGELDQLVPGEPEPDIFKLIDAVAQRDPRQGLPRLAELLDSGENENKILATLSRQFRNIAAASAAREQGLGAKQLAGALGINPYVAEKSFVQSGRFSGPELARIIARLARADHRMKTGRREPRLELELAVVEICSPGSRR
jgi:DNA polymerase-3 subunit delta